MTKGEITQLSRSIEGLKSIKVNCNLTHYQFDSLVYALAVLERVSDVEMLEQLIGSFDSESSDTFPRELAQVIVKELTGKVGK